MHVQPITRRQKKKTITETKIQLHYYGNIFNVKPYVKPYQTYLNYNKEGKIILSGTSVDSEVKVTTVQKLMCKSKKIPTS